MKEIVEYILATKIKCAIMQAIIESKKDIDFISLEELAFAISADSIRFLEKYELISIVSKDSK